MTGAEAKELVESAGLHKIAVCRELGVNRSALEKQFAKGVATISKRYEYAIRYAVLVLVQREQSASH